MGTTTISGTAASGAGTATLASLRDRVIQMSMNTSSGIDQTPISASALTLAAIRDRVELALQDSGNAIWASGDIDEALTHALEQYSRYRPQHLIGTVTLSADGREIDISSLTGAIRIERVWWDYDSSDPSYPPTWRRFKTWPGSILYISDTDEPKNGDKVRVWYTKAHTLNGLAGASATTFPIDDQSFVINGAASFAARFRAVGLAEQATVDGQVQLRLMEWARTAMSEFTEGLRFRDWRTYTFNYNQEDIDEAIRWALHRYSEISPAQSVTALTLSATGREIDISPITNYQQIYRVWWPYTSGDPEYPPRWKEFNLWPNNVLFLDDEQEPSTADVVRIWYSKMRTLNGLDGASVTSLPGEDETLIVIGAAGFAAQETVQEEERRYVPRKLREWAHARLGEFERGLKRVAKRIAARHSGIAKVPALDKWEDGSGWR